MKYPAIILMLLFLSSCKLVVHRVIYNSRIFPNYASDKKIDKFYDKHAVTKTNYITLSEPNFVKKIKEPGWAFESWNLYNTDGFKVRRKGDSLSCIVSDHNFLKEFDLNTMGFIDSTNHLSNDTIAYSKIFGDDINLLTSEKAYNDFDFTLILYWSSWRGRYSSQILKLEEIFVLNHPELKIQVIKINMDFRKEMKETIDKMQLTANEYKYKKAHINK
ncbi:hypothetical protein [Brumimicrobium sp.]|uniref:hypothetical protein n=1 Tax=Brumimicrobium sp. TaxID=2029867 RepID=UPI00263967AE|nr:hypothetical protein [uncultured Brumimicrobium sp.]